MTKKYRPYLSLPMMESMVKLCDNYLTQPFGPPEEHLREHTKDIKDSLQVMILKARHEITKPSYVPISSRIGMNVPINEQTGPSYRYNAGLMSLEERTAYEAELMNEIISGNQEQENL